MTDSWHVQLITLYPEMFPGPLGASLPGKALKEHKWCYSTINPRDFATDKHRSVDDTPCGGGAGMVMRADIIDNALKELKKSSKTPPTLLYMSPRGTPLTQNRVKTLAKQKNIAIMCGRFEGIDQRVLDAHQVEEVSIGDYILFGGELAAMVLMEACIRHLPGVLGAEDSLSEESFSEEDPDFSGLLEYPHYTRPTQWEGMNVPEVLLSGHHAKIRQWRLEQAQKVTQTRRPDLWKAYTDRTKK
jgi:tRNA (guanine37-N1)-methyltransferase